MMLNVYEYQWKNYHPNTKQSHGFSLVELLVVVAILAILAAIAIPLFLNQRSKAAQGAVQSDARNLATNLTAIFANLPRSADPNVALNGSTVPNTTLSGSGTISVGGETLNVSLSPDVTIVRTGNDNPSFGAGLKITHAGVDNWACVISLPPSVGYAQTSSLQPTCGKVVSDEGNMISFYQATFTPTVPYNRTLSGWYWARISPTYVGIDGYTQYVETEVTGTSDPYINGNVVDFIGNGIDVDGFLTGTIAVKKMSGQESIRFCLRIYDNVNTGWAAMMVNRCEIVTLTDEWTVVSIPVDTSSLPHPVDRANIILGIHGLNPVVGNTFAVKDGGLWMGEGGQWAVPGVPIVKP